MARAGRAALRCAALLLPLAFVSAAAAESSDTAGALLVRGESLARGGRCEEALPVLERASALDPSDGRALVLAGQCEIRLKRFPQAVTTLEAAKRLPAPPPDTDLYLGIARFHAGDLPGAERALADARERTPDRAELDLYQGLLLLENGRPREAAEMLDRARERDAAAVEPLASYYAGLAWARAKEVDRARSSFQRVQVQAPGSPWGEAAGRAREALDSGDTGRLFASASFGVEYNSNVVLRGTGVALPSDISGQGDFDVVWTVQAGYEVYRDADWTVGLMGSYFGNHHFDLDTYDVEFPMATLWIDRRLLESTTARMQYDAGYAAVGGDSYLVSHTVTPSIFQDWGRFGTTHFYVAMSWNNFLYTNTNEPDGAPGTGPGSPCPGGFSLCGPPGFNEAVARNRDGFGMDTGIEHRIPLGFAATELRGGVDYLDYDARGQDYSFKGFEGHLGTRSQLPLGFVLDLQGTYAYLPYASPSSYPNGPLVAGQQYALNGFDRRDRFFEFDAIVERKLTDWLTGSLRYSYVNNDSNTDVFNYDQTLVGAYLTVRFSK